MWGRGWWSRVLGEGGPWALGPGLVGSGGSWRGWFFHWGSLAGKGPLAGGRGRGPWRGGPSRALGLGGRLARKSQN